MREHVEKKIKMPLEGEMIKIPFFGKIKKSSEKYIKKKSLNCREHPWMSRNTEKYRWKDEKGPWRETLPKCPFLYKRMR